MVGKGTLFDLLLTMHDELWRKIVTVHNYNKTFFIWCEENGIGLKTFLQPNNELKNAWEHVVRAKARELGITKEADPDYIKLSLTDALKHECRAFYDICDWLSWTLRKQFQDNLLPYDHETIIAVIPNYFQEIRPRFDEIVGEIARLRATKDAEAGEIMTHIEEHKTTLEKLIKDVQHISHAVGALAEFKMKKESAASKKEKRELNAVIIAAIVGAIFGSGLTVLGEWLLFGNK